LGIADPEGCIFAVAATLLATMLFGAAIVAVLF
jgi:hypothetical protein